MIAGQPAVRHGDEEVFLALHLEYLGDLAIEGCIGAIVRDPANDYSGGSMVIDPYGNIIAACEDGNVSSATAGIDMDLLEAFRAKFPVLNDSDVL